MVSLPSMTLPTHLGAPIPGGKAMSSLMSVPIDAAEQARLELVVEAVPAADGKAALRGRRGRPNDWRLE